MCSALSMAEQKHIDMLSQKDGIIDNLRRNEMTYKDELERLRQSLAK